MPRVERENMFIRMAEVLAERSTCEKLKVGAILVKDNRIISSGYNGAPSGLEHCTEAGCDIEQGTGACIRTVHAEANAIIFAARAGISTEGSTLYTTVSPCFHCSKLIVNAGVKKVVYASKYRLDTGLHLMERCGVEIKKLNGD